MAFSALSHSSLLSVWRCKMYFALTFPLNIELKSGRFALNTNAIKCPMIPSMMRNIPRLCSCALHRYILSLIFHPARFLSVLIKPVMIKSKSTSPMKKYASLCSGRYFSLFHAGFLPCASKSAHISHLDIVPPPASFGAILR